jgi:hypothetical protein
MTKDEGSRSLPVVTEPAPPITGDATVDEMLHRAGQQALRNGPDCPDVSTLLAAVWRQADSSAQAMDADESPEEDPGANSGDDIRPLLADAIATAFGITPPTTAHRTRRSRWSWSLARLAGAHPEVLSRATTEGDRYTAMGGVLLTTAGMAGVSAAFALNSAVALSPALAVVGGLLWAIAIFNLDRMLIISMTRQKGWWRNAFAAVPRVLLAIVIGTVISVPLVLRIFQPAIDSEMQVLHAEANRTSEAAISREYPDVPALQKQITQLQAVASGQSQPAVSQDPDVVAAQHAVDIAQTSYNRAFTQAECELNGTCGTRHAGTGILFDMEQQQVNDTKKTLDNAQARLTTATRTAQARISADTKSSQSAAQRQLPLLQTELRQRQLQRDAAVNTAVSSEAGNTGLIARLESLDRLSAQDSTVAAASFLLMLLFLTVEILPVAAKLLWMSGREPSLYDEVLADEERRLRQASTQGEEVVEKVAQAATKKALESIDRIFATYTDEQMVDWMLERQTRFGGLGELGHRRGSPRRSA